MTRPIFNVLVVVMATSMIHSASSFVVGGLTSASPSLPSSSTLSSPPLLSQSQSQSHTGRFLPSVGRRKHPDLDSTAISASVDDATTSSASSSSSAAVVTTNDDPLMNPSYDIEPLQIRMGHGFDIHRMAPIEEAKQPVVIGGVTITHKDQKWTDKDGKYVDAGGIYETQLGVVAHSDGDVIYHSVVDAIFGALTLPDIGQVFQDTDPRWKGCDSSKFMEYAYEVMTKYGYQIGNIDVTLILERPKVASFKPAMKENIVNLLHTTPGRVNIKARTHEQVDSVGELRSLSCHVVLSLERVKSAA